MEFYEHAPTDVAALLRAVDDQEATPRRRVG